MAKYRVLQGIDYPPNKRAEIGDVVEDLPATSIKWLLESGLIEDASKPAKKVEEKIEESTEEIIEIAKEEKPPYVPEAKDGDKDGLIQDGTKWERPVGTELTEEELLEKLESDK
jgi:hypothetical protein